MHINNCIFFFIFFPVPNKNEMKKISPHSSPNKEMNNNNRASSVGSEKIEPNKKDKLEKKIRRPEKPSISSCSSPESVSKSPSPRKRCVSLTKMRKVNVPERGRKL